VVIKVWDKDRWTSDDFLGEAAVPVKGLKNGKPVEEWYTLANEPKKTKDKNPNKPPAEIRLRLHFPTATQEPEVEEKKPATAGATTSVGGKTAGKITDKYTIGKELGRYVPFSPSPLLFSPHSCSPCSSPTLCFRRDPILHPFERNKLTRNTLRSFSLPFLPFSTG